MPNIKSAKKRVEVNERNHARNKSAISRMKTEIKKFNTAISNEDVEKAEELLPKTIAIIDKTESKGIIHKNTANRHKSRSAEKLNELKTKNN